MLLNSLPVDWTLNQRVPGSSPGAHHPVSANRVFPALRRIGRLCGIFGHSFFRFWSLWAFTRLGDDFGCPVSASENSVPGGQFLAARRLTYSGLSPSASNCRLHSVGGSRRRSM